MYSNVWHRPELLNPTHGSQTHFVQGGPQLSLPRLSTVVTLARRDGEKSRASNQDVRSDAIAGIMPYVFFAPFGQGEDCKLELKSIERFF
ncbi:hypothetical protein INR49_015013 [Caranx melampygus]|nr:hypothetical protein INR49_015013 [Caranx melampygus]